MLFTSFYNCVLYIYINACADVFDQFKKIYHLLLGMLFGVDCYLQLKASNTAKAMQYISSLCDMSALMAYFSLACIGVSTKLNPPYMRRHFCLYSKVFELSLIFCISLIIDLYMLVFEC